MRVKRRVHGVVLYLALGALAMVVILSISCVVLSSFKSTDAILASSSLLPKKISFHNYVRAREESNFRKYIWNSIFVCTAIVIGTIVTSITPGYVFSRGNFLGKRPLLGLITFSIFISAGSLYPFPQLQIARSMHLNNPLWGIITIYIFGTSVTQLYLSKGFVDGIPREIDKTAQMGGRSFFKTFLCIIFPLTRPFMATVGLLSFMNSWSDYLLPPVFTLGDPDKQPLVVGIMSMRNAGETISSWDLMMAGTIMAAMPVLAVFVMLNKYFVAGLTSEVVKG